MPKNLDLSIVDQVSGDRRSQGHGDSPDGREHPLWYFLRCGNGGSGAPGRKTGNAGKTAVVITLPDSGNGCRAWLFGDHVGGRTNVIGLPFDPAQQSAAWFIAKIFMNASHARVVFTAAGSVYDQQDDFLESEQRSRSSSPEVSAAFPLQPRRVSCWCFSAACCSCTCAARPACRCCASSSTGGAVRPL